MSSEKAAAASAADEATSVVLADQPQPEPTVPTAPLARMDSEAAQAAPAPRSAQEERDELTLRQLAIAMSNSGFFRTEDNRVMNAAQVVVKVLAGRDLGIPPVPAMTGIHIVQGHVTLAASTMAALIQRSQKYRYRIVSLTNIECRIEFYERLGRRLYQDQPDEALIGVSVFTLDDAKRAGLVRDRSPWTHYPRNMLFARALSNGARWFTPEIFYGPVYVPEEVSDQTTEPTATPPTPTAVPEERDEQ